MKFENGIYFLLICLSIIMVSCAIVLFFNGDISRVDYIKILIVGGICPLIEIIIISVTDNIFFKGLLK